MAPITQQVWKYELAISSDNMPVAIAMPVGAQILTTQLQADKICLWAKVNPVGDSEQRYFVTVMTGESMMPSPGLYIGTVQVGAFVVHVYEVTQSVQ